MSGFSLTVSEEETEKQEGQKKVSESFMVE